MMYANKVVLANSARVSMLELRHLELDLYTNNSRNIAFKAVLIGAIGWSGLVYTKKDYYQLADSVFLHIYPAALMMNVGYSFLTVVQFNLIALAAPGLALRGPDGSVHLAVEGMLIEYRRATHWFAQSIVWTLLTLLVYAWSGDTYRPFYNKLGLTCLAIVGMVLIYAQARHVAKQFSTSTVYSGSFYPEDHRDPAYEMLDSLARTPPAAEAEAKPQPKQDAGGQRKQNRGQHEHVPADQSKGRGFRRLF